MDKRLRAIVFGLPRPVKRIIVMIVDVGGGHQGTHF